MTPGRLLKSTARAPFGIEWVFAQPPPRVGNRLDGWAGPFGARFCAHSTIRIASGGNGLCWLHEYSHLNGDARLLHACRLDAIFQAGFGSSSRVYEVSDKILGMPPAQYRAGAPGMAISFAVGQSTLGSILGARTTKGVCAILLGDDPQVLVQQLQDWFPRAHLNGNDRGFDRWFSQIVGLVEAPGTGLPLPLDIGGTVFQRKV